MRRSIASIAFLALLTVPCIAEPDSVTTGPYNISFDLGMPVSEYRITIDPPKESELLGGEKYNTYNMEIKDKSETSAIPGFATIGIVQYESEIQLSPDDMIEALREKNPDTTKRKIDGSDGAISKMQLKTTERGQTSIADVFYVRFYLNADPKHSVCTIVSIYPWDEGTLSLLKTIHIEKINET